MRLPPDQERPLADALMASFDIEGLKVVLRSRLGVQLEDISSGGVRETVFWKVIDWFQQTSTVEKLIVAIHDARPFVPEIRAIADRVLAPPIEDPTKLERRLAEQVPDLDPVIFRERQAAMEPRVCSITIGSGRDATGGTGFLVGPDLVLTCEHVMRPALDGSMNANDVLLRFDFRRLRDGHPATFGVTYNLAAQWKVQSDAKLDYALVRLDARAGDEPIGSRKAEEGAPRRGFIELPSGPIDATPDAPLLILHHPNGQELKLAPETKSILGLYEDGTRLRHRTNTNGGSSGAPCFDMNWTLLGIHRGTNKRHPFNEAVPIDVVAAAIRDVVREEEE